MFSKSLFKQSCKANGTMWAIITFAVCFMLACVMLITGGGNLADTKNAIQDNIIQGEMTSQMQQRALNYYGIANDALAHFDKTFAENATVALEKPEIKAIYENTYKTLLSQGVDGETAVKKSMEAMVAAGYASAYEQSADELKDYAAKIAKDRGFAAGSAQEREILGVIFTVFNPLNPDGETCMFDKFYEDHNETKPRYDITTLATSTEAERKSYRQDYVTKNSVVFLAGNLIEPENVDMIVDELSNFGVTMDKYEEFGFNKYDKVKEVGMSAIIDFRANYDYRISHMSEGETEQSIVEELSKDITRSLLASLPAEVSEALEEIGQEDLYGTLVGTIFFKMAGLLLPIIYLIMTANALIAGQVDSGSMAYVLSSSVKRRTVTFTQAVYLIGSLFLMCCMTAITSIVCLSIVDVDTGLTYSKLLLINLGAFLVLFAMSGLCFLTSCWFNRSKRSMAIGGGLNMFFLVATMLGLFGSSVLPSILRMEALNNFNYVSIITLFDVDSILSGGLTYLWKFGILFVTGFVLYIAGSEKFARKDLPL